MVSAEMADLGPAKRTAHLPRSGGPLRSPSADRTVVASGTSCLERLDSLLDRPAIHPVELLDPDSQH